MTEISLFLSFTQCNIRETIKPAMLRWARNVTYMMKVRNS
jgi:hypothetical protein